MDKVGTAHFSSDAKRAKLKAFRTHLAKANGGTDVSDRQLWEFLKTLHVLSYDLDTETGATASLLQSLIAQYSIVSAPFLWSRIISAVQSADYNAGTTREQRIQDLMEEIGCDRQEAEGRLLDDDLWLVEPARRAGLDGEEAVKQWEWAAGFAECLENGFAFTGWADLATSQLIVDMRERAEEALRRARARAKAEALD